MTCDAPPMARPPRLWTIGYAEARTAADVLGPLVDAGVERLVDVRALPLSRRPGFSKRALAAATAEAGLVYLHVRELGTPASMRQLFRTQRDLPEGRRQYASHLDVPEVALALDALAGEVGRARHALLCVEADPATCHRALLADALAARLPGLAVVDLAVDRGTSPGLSSAASA